MWSWTISGQNEKKVIKRYIYIRNNLVEIKMETFKFSIIKILILVSM